MAEVASKKKAARASAGAEDDDSIPKDKEKEVLASDVVVGEYLQLGEGVCRVVSVSTFGGKASGKQDKLSAKRRIQIDARHVVTGAAEQRIVPAAEALSRAEATRAVYTVVDVDDGYVVLMDEQGECRSDIPMPKEAALETRIRNFVKANIEGVATVLSTTVDDEVIEVIEEVVRPKKAGEAEAEASAEPEPEPAPPAADERRRKEKKPKEQSSKAEATGGTDGEKASSRRLDRSRSPEE